VTSVEHLAPAVVVHVLAGELRKAEVDAVCAAVDAARAGGGAASPFVLDLARVTFAGSLALGVLVGLSKEFRARNQRLVFVNLQPDVREPIQISRLNSVLEILPDVPTALRAFRDNA
jgi:anti-anti-sigma factor